MDIHYYWTDKINSGGADCTAERKAKCIQIIFDRKGIQKGFLDLRLHGPYPLGQVLDHPVWRLASQFVCCCAVLPDSIADRPTYILAQQRLSLIHI